MSEDNKFEFYNEGNDLESYVYQALGAASVCWETLEGAGIFESDRAVEIGKALIQKIQETHQDQGTLQYKIHRQKKMLTALEKARGVEVIDIGYTSREGEPDDYRPVKINWNGEEWMRVRAYETWKKSSEASSKKLQEAYVTLNSTRTEVYKLREENSKLRLMLKGRDE
jgi:hypothetical protein